MGDTQKTLAIVLVLGIVLVGGIYGAIRIGGSNLLSDEDALREAGEISDELKYSEKQEKERREKLISRIKVVSKKRKDGVLPSDARKKLWSNYESLSAEQHIDLLKLLMPQEFHTGLSKFYEKNKTPEERKVAIGKIVTQMQDGFGKLSDKQLWERRQKIDTAQGKAYIKVMQQFYGSKMNSDQRSDFEPVAREWMRQYEVVIQANRPR